MKNFILVLTFLLTSFGVFSQSNKTLVKSFTNVTDNVSFEVSCEKTIKYWPNSYVRIEVNISTNYSEELLSSLVKSGRYDLFSKIENGVTLISLPNLSREIVIRGEKIKEKLNLVVWLPENSVFYR